MNVRLSEKHGVNPCLPVCFLCGEDKGEIALLGRLKGDVEAPHRAVLTQEPCDKCKHYQKTGVILISVSDALTTDKQNPYRTGGWVVVREEAVSRMLVDADAVLEKRVAFLTDEAWDEIGLPRVEKKEKEC